MSRPKTCADCNRRTRGEASAPLAPGPIASEARGAGCVGAGRCERAAAEVGSTFVEPAREALLAAFLVHERGLPALLAQVTDPPALLQLGAAWWRALRLDLADMLGQRARERVGKREDLAGAEAHRLGAADARELADNLFEPTLR